MRKALLTALPVLLAFASPAFAGVTVNSPSNGSQVSAPFNLSAYAGPCSSQPISAMGYSLDSSTNTTIVNGTSINASVPAANGWHTVHVKSWGNQGASCVTDVSVDVTSQTATAASTSSASADGITVNSPANNASVGSQFWLSAGASYCSGQPVSAMGYSLDSSTSTTTVGGTVIGATVSAPGGYHTLHVKSWGNQGAGCMANVAINVTSSGTTTTTASTTASSGGSSAYIPSTAKSVSSIQTLSNWKEAFDNATNGGASGWMTLTGSPSLSGNARQFSMNFSNNGGERYWSSFGDDTAAQNFVYDAWVYVNSSVNAIANIEMDLNQVMANGQTVIYGFQCDGWNNTWDVTKNAGSATYPKDTWVRSNAGCNPRSWAQNKWHHVQISYSRDTWGNVTYHSVWLDGNQQPINITVYSAFALGWAPTLVTNFQVDGLGSGSATVWVDKLTVYRW